MNQSSAVMALPLNMSSLSLQPPLSVHLVAVRWAEEKRGLRRESKMSLTVEQMYNITVRADTFNNTQTGQDSDQYTIAMEGNGDFA